MIALCVKALQTSPAVMAQKEVKKLTLQKQALLSSPLLQPHTCDTIPFREGKQPVLAKLTAFLLLAWQETGSMHSTLPCAISSWQGDGEQGRALCPRGSSCARDGMHVLLVTAARLDSGTLHQSKPPYPDTVAPSPITAVLPDPTHKPGMPVATPRRVEHPLANLATGLLPGVLS